LSGKTERSEVPRAEYGWFMMGLLRSVWGCRVFRRLAGLGRKFRGETWW
jgi:hypothetical protein